MVGRATLPKPKLQGSEYHWNLVIHLDPTQTFLLLSVASAIGTRLDSRFKFGSSCLNLTRNQTHDESLMPDTSRNLVPSMYVRLFFDFEKDLGR